MPILRFIFNFRKIETTDEVKMTSGFYIRYLIGIGLLYLYLMFFIEIYPEYFIIIFLTFHVICINTLKNSSYIN